MFSKEKFKALIHYACASVENPRDLGAVKLNKIAWIVDGNAFVRTGESLTGARYVKQPMGTVPKAMLPTLNELQREGSIRIDDVSYFGRLKKEYVSLREPDTIMFSDDEIRLIDEVVAAISKNHIASSISDITHGTIWQLAEIGEDMPFHAMLVEDLDDVSDENIAFAKEQLAMYSLRSCGNIEDGMAIPIRIVEEPAVMVQVGLSHAAFPRFHDVYDGLTWLLSRNLVPQKAVQIAPGTYVVQTQKLNYPGFC